ncbi:MAG: HEAT repeat domain-containing protein [Planctomycetota bacterium]
MWRVELAMVLLLAEPQHEASRLLESGRPIDQVRVLEDVEKGDIQIDGKILVQLAVKGDVWPVRQAAARALRKAGPPDAPKQLAAFAAVRSTEAAALEALGVLGGKEAVVELAAFCRKSRGDRTRVRALEALAVTGLPEALPFIREQLLTRVPMIQGAAIRALGELGRPESLSSLWDLAGALETRDLRIRAGVALRRLGHTVGDLPLETHPGKLVWQLEVLSVAGAMIKADQLAPLLGHKDPGVRAWAVYLCARAGDKGEMALAASRCKGDETLERNQVLLLSRLEPDAASDLLVRLMGSPHVRVRLETVAQLARTMTALTKAESALLKTALEDGSWDVAVVAAYTLARRGCPDLPGLLEPMTSHGDWRRRAGAYYAMTFVKDVKVIDALGRGLADADGMTARLARRILSTVTGITFRTDTEFFQWRSAEGKDFAFSGTRRSLARYEPSESVDAAYRTMASSEILVKVDEDRVDTVLTSLGFRITDISRQRLEDVDLNPEQVLVLTCAVTLTPKDIERVDWFVTLGGALVMTDEALGRPGCQPVPGYVAIHSEVTFREHTLHPAETPDPDHPLLNDVFTREGRHDGSLAIRPRGPRYHYAPWDQWGSFMIEVADPFRTEVLADSLEMRQRFGASPLACTWPHGLGRALHAVSHFGHQMEEVRKLLEPREPSERIRAVVDELGYPLETAQGWMEAGKLKNKSEDFLRGSFPLFSLMGNFIREQKTFLESGASQERSR